MEPKSSEKIRRLPETQEHARLEVKSRIEDGSWSLLDYPCQLCLHLKLQPKHKLVSHCDRYGIEIPIGMCLKCGLIRSLKRLDDQSLADFYSSLYRRLYTGSACPSPEFFNEQFRRGLRLRRFLEKESAFRFETVVEVGAGAGGVISAVIGAGNMGYVCDFDSEYLKMAETRGHKALVGSVNDFPSEFADLVIYSHVLEHVVDLKKELSEVRRILKPNGCLLVEVPGIYRTHWNYRSDFRLSAQTAHLNYFSLALLNSVVIPSGFSLIKGNNGVKALYIKSSNYQTGNESARRLAPIMIRGYLTVLRLIRLPLLPLYVALEALIRLRSHSSKAE